ncbi:hypothetical protein [Christiangramia sp. SM2212]|uniref:Uncharacterized protein n=1 Tax=Christiangramia sediminicola TaxID=3073267 RepID=A0ABU1ES54_9FLAO|nr:hypothetical protein [Christiangramia sp. SM2212]MDR5591211.1 hypothetical protein [Christiangramia sp. SM2212]
MNYYFITPDLNLNVVSVSDQIRITSDYRIEDSKFIDNFYFEEVCKPKLANAVLEHRAKLTDYIDISASGFSHRLLISDKLKNILSNSIKERFQFFRNKVYQNNQGYDFWLVHPISDGLNWINFSKSELVLRKRKRQGGTVLVNYPKINSAEKFLNEVMRLKTEKKRLMLNKVHILDGRIDFFCLRYVVGGVKYIVSEKIKSEIEYQKITGLKFEII